MTDSRPLAIRSKEKIKAITVSVRSVKTYIVKLDKVSSRMDAKNKSNADSMIIESKSVLASVVHFDFNCSRLFTPA